MLSQATTVSLTGTADDSFVAYLSTDLTLDSTDIRFASGTIGTYTTSSATLDGSSSYLLVEAVNTIGNGTGYAQFVAALSLSDAGYTFSNGSGQLVTNTSDWLASTSNNLSGAGYATQVAGADSTRPGDLAAAVGIWTPSTTENSTVYFATQLTAAAVPEPESAMLMLGGLAALGLVARRKARTAAA